ncbi:MAG: PAS domain S-box protein [Gammaproteobacteria bacterium]|nr:PAS domain S-box protein [Gammaproteobacteria bacterium]
MPIENTWYEQLVEHAPDALLLVDSDGIIRLANHQAETLFEYSREELVGNNVDMLVPKSVRGHHHVHRDGFFMSPKSRNMGEGSDLEGVKKGGEKFAVEISLSPVKTDEGMFVVAAVRDATNRQKTQNQLRSLLETAPDAMVIINSGGEIVLVNKQTEKLFGYSREALIGKKVEVLIPEHLRDGHVGRRDGYFTAPRVREMGAGQELAGRRKDGSVFPIEISLSPFESDEGTFATAAIRDITSRKQAEDQLRAVLETAPDAMVIIDDTGTITLVNQQAEAMFDYQRSELVGQPIEILIPEHLRNRHKGYRGGYFDAPKRREMGIGLELSGRRRNGTTFPVEISLGPLNTEHGRWATAAVRDLSERKRVEQLEVSHREMEHFSYAASHDLKAPLRNIVSLIDLLKEDLEEIDLPEHIQDTLGLISTNTGRMHSLVQDLLEFSRVDRHERVFETVDLNELLHETCELIEADILSANADVRYNSLPTITVDRVLMRQLLQNLLTNAIKFQPPGQRPIVDVSVKELEDDWEIAVADNGVGISKEYKEQVFQVFSRLHDLQEYEGNGIGLAICKKIVDIHHGQIGISDNSPQGTTFHFTVAKRA